MPTRYHYPLSIMGIFDLQNLFLNSCLSKKQEISSELFLGQLLLSFLFTKSQHLKFSQGLPKTCKRKDYMWLLELGL